MSVFNTPSIVVCIDAPLPDQSLEIVADSDSAAIEELPTDDRKYVDQHDHAVTVTPDNGSRLTLTGRVSEDDAHILAALKVLSQAVDIRSPPYDGVGQVTALSICETDVSGHTPRLDDDAILAVDVEIDLFNATGE
ncbi:MAG: hypothetical protein ABEJ68_03775 [Halobacteriaceae archaeon]